MTRRVRLAAWLFAHSRTARIAFVLATWPIVTTADRVRGINPPARWADGWRWATRPADHTGGTP